MPFELKRIPTGGKREKYRIYAVCSGRGDSQLLDFLIDPPAPSDSILRCIKEAAKDGPHMLPAARAHAIDKPNSIYELIGGRLRIAYFSDNDKIIICTHGFLKASQKTSKKDRRTASQAKRAYLEAKKRGDLLFTEDDEEDK